MSGIIGRSRQKLGKFIGGKFDPKKASEEAGVKWIIKGAFLSDRLEAISEMSFDENVPTEVDEFLSMSAQTWQSAIPWLKIRNERHMHKKIIAYLRLHSMFVKYRKRLKENKQMRKIILEDLSFDPAQFGVDPALAGRLDSAIKEDDVDVENPLTSDEEEAREMTIGYLVNKLPRVLKTKISIYAVESLSQNVENRRLDLLRVSKLLIALSFDKTDVEPAPPVVIMKPESPPMRVQAPPAFRSSRQMEEMSQIIQRLEYEQRKTRSKGD